jgi:hypothetical protein
MHIPCYQNFVLYTVQIHIVQKHEVPFLNVDGNGTQTAGFGTYKDLEHLEHLLELR